MLSFLVRNKLILIIFAIWYAVGSVSPVLFYPLGGITVLLLWRKGMYFEIFLGFFFILILSDNLKYTTDFAKTFKNAYIVLLAVIAVLDRKNFPVQSKILPYFLPFLLVSIIGIFYSPQIFVSFQKTLSYGLLLFVVPQFFVNSFNDRGPEVVKDLIYFAVAMIILGFLVRFVSPNLVYSHGGRFRGIFGNPNGLGIFGILIFAFALISREYFKALFSKADLRWIFIPIGIALVLSGSRSAVIAVMLFFLFSRFYRFSPFLGFILFLSVAVAAQLLSRNLIEIVNALGISEYFRVDTLEDGSGRYVAWNFAWEAIQEYFWFGRGFSFDEWLMDTNQDFLNDLGHQGGVHNTYLIVWLNTGIVGLIMFLRGYLVLIIKGAKNAPMAFPLLWMVLFSIMLEPWLAASLNPFTILLLMSLSMLTHPVFQPYIRGELSSTQKPNEEPVLA